MLLTNIFLIPGHYVAVILCSTEPATKRERVTAMKGWFLATALTILSATVGSLASFPAPAGTADVVDAEVTMEALTGDETFYRFTVTVRHADEGWDHYADAFEIVSPDGTVLGTRVLAHPHVNEQPFTRTLSAVAIPEGVTEVVIRARDSVHGHGGETMTVAIPQP